MDNFAVGSVPYLNAKPLIKPLLWQGANSPVKVCLEVPSRLPDLLTSGQVQAIMVSSIAALTDPECTVAAGLSISTQNEVLSVRLFSKRPFHQITRLAEDQSSMTSNALAKILLKQRHSVTPETMAMPPDGSAMLESCDACVLIGDNGMRFRGDGLYVMDLGEEWRLLTELPFVWAVWKGDHRLDPRLVGHLQRSLETSKRNLNRVLDEASEETGFTLEECRHYVEDIMDYRLEDDHLRALGTFGTFLKEQGLIDDYAVPKVVESIPVISH